MQESSESFVEQEASLPPQQEQEDLDEEEYELEDADIIREASSLDDMAKLITVEEVCTSPLPGLLPLPWNPCMWHRAAFCPQNVLY